MDTASSGNDKKLSIVILSANSRAISLLLRFSARDLIGMTKIFVTEYSSAQFGLSQFRHAALVDHFAGTLFIAKSKHDLVPGFDLRAGF